MMQYCCLFPQLCIFSLSVILGWRFAVGQQPLESPACVAAKEACHNDTDCLHRVMYLHSTCVTGSCQPQCKIAVLNLYETSAGRKLLETDLSCISGVESEMAQCGLVPTRIPMHCSLARLVCEADPLCRNDMDVFESLCHDSENAELEECSDQCGTYLAKVFRKSKGAALRSCTCWKRDPLCNHLKETLLSKCTLKAGSIVDNTNENKTSQKNNKNGDNNGEKTKEENSDYYKKKNTAVPEPNSQPENGAQCNNSYAIVFFVMLCFSVMCIGF